MPSCKHILGINSPQAKESTAKVLSFFVLSYRCASLLRRWRIYSVKVTKVITPVTYGHNVRPVFTSDPLLRLARIPETVSVAEVSALLGSGVADVIEAVVTKLPVLLMTPVRYT
jgi:hypothetical protein